MLARIAQFLFDRVLNSVPFGICTMSLLAAYIAVGSGLPQVREMFEMNEQQFFSAWPLKALVGLLVVNLAVVTWVRIPFTPPRYGVWMIHTGIITLILGMAAHYSLKVEGMVRVFQGQTVDYYYDRYERMLYARLTGVPQMGGIPAGAFPLPSLPRFKAYDELHQNAAALDRPDLRNRVPVLQIQDSATGQRSDRTLKQALELPDELRVDVIGYYPYAEIGEQFITDPAGGETGLELQFEAPDGQAMDRWLLASDPARSGIRMQGAEIEHHHTNSTIVDALRQAASQLHQVEATVGDFKQTMFVEPGQTYTLGDTGYSFKVEFFQPNWSMFGTNEPVDSLVLMVTSPTQTYRRMILNGKELQTDFQLNVDDAGPMGKRQTTPLDADLVLHYTFRDPFQLLPMNAAVKHNLVTRSDGSSIIDIVTGTAVASSVTELPDDGGSITIDPSASASPLMAAMAPTLDAPGIPIRITRNDNVRVEEVVRVVPSAQRQRDLGETGQMQVLKVRVTMGDWSQEAYVPFSDGAMEMPWSGPEITIPGTRAKLALQLGTTRLQLPARLTLNEFELVPYPGATPAMGGMMRDFKSHLTVEDPRTGNRREAVAHMNNPIYFDGGDWLFFQATYDPQGQWTGLGIGNRPAVHAMTIGCIMMFVGLMYAFYVKPVVIRRMKQNALARAVLVPNGVATIPANSAPSLASSK